MTSGQHWLWFPALRDSDGMNCGLVARTVVRTEKCLAYVHTGTVGRHPFKVEVEVGGGRDASGVE